MANFGSRYLGDGEALGRLEVRFGQTTEASDYYQIPEFHKRGRRQARLPESTIFFLCAKAEYFQAWFGPH